MENVIELSSDSDSEISSFSQNHVENVLDNDNKIQLLINKYNSYKTSSAVTIREDFDEEYLNTKRYSYLGNNNIVEKVHTTDEVDIEGVSHNSCTSLALGRCTQSITSIVVDTLQLFGSNSKEDG